MWDGLPTDLEAKQPLGNQNEPWGGRIGATQQGKMAASAHPLSLDENKPPAVCRLPEVNWAPLEQLLPGDNQGSLRERNSSLPTLASLYLPALASD